MKILLAGGGTGGHLMPALALAQALVEAHAGVEPILVGAERGIESQVLPRYPFRFQLLPLEPVYRRTWWRNVRWPFIAGRLLREVALVFEEEQPLAVLGTGGYASAPVVWWASRHGTPTAIQEQNAYPGLATRWLSRRVRHVYLGLPEARRLLRFGRKTMVFDTGNPILPPIRARRARAWSSRCGAPTAQAGTINGQTVKPSSSSCAATVSKPRVTCPLTFSAMTQRGRACRMNRCISGQRWRGSASPCCLPATLKVINFQVRTCHFPVLDSSRVCIFH